MNTKTAHQLDNLCRRQLHRIWLQRVLSYMYPVSWWAASVFFMGGTIHQLLLPLEVITVTAIAIVPLLLILCFAGYSRKPTKSEAVIATDRHLRANSLFVSSWELVHSAATLEGIRKLLIARAETALPDWRQRLDQQLPRFMQASTLAVLSIAGIGLFLLLLPPPAHVMTASSEDSLLQDKVAEPSEEIAYELNRLFRPVEKVTTANQSSQLSQQRKPEQENINSYPSNNRNNLAPAQTGHEQMIDNAVRALQATGQLSTAEQAMLITSTPLEDGSTSSQGAGNNNATQPDKVLSSAVVFDQISLVEVNIEQDNATSVFNRDLAGVELNIRQAQQSPLSERTKSALGQQINSYLNFATRMNAAQRYAVSRYFKQMEKIDESHE